MLLLLLGILSSVSVSLIDQKLQLLCDYSGSDSGLEPQWQAMTPSLIPYGLLYKLITNIIIYLTIGAVE